ncbi:MAG: [FeFe] hydrogenase H-cluster maturation GTPase HydF [Ignavibacteriaceae bacterium]
MDPSESIYRPHIAVVGKRNVGKSRFVNTLIGKEVSAVSDIAGTTVDLIKNPLELIPYGPVLVVDTAGIDDNGELGSGRITQTIQTISSADLVILIIDSRTRLISKERELIAYLDKIGVCYFIVINKIEFGVKEELLEELSELRVKHFEVSCKENVGFEELKRKIIRMLPREDEKFLLTDIIAPSDIVMMVIPSQLREENSEFLLSYVEIIKSHLDKNTKVILCNNQELPQKLAELKTPPDIIITESFIINNVETLVSEKVKITTFTMILNRLKTDMSVFIKGLKTVQKLVQGDKVLFADGCRNHPEDNGKLKIKEWLGSDSKRELKFDYINNGGLPDNLSEYKLLLHCDGCKLNRGDIRTRINEAILMDVPVVTYGVVSAYMNNVLPRALQLLKIKIHQ